MKKFKVGDKVKNIECNGLSKDVLFTVSRLRDMENSRETMEVDGDGKTGYHTYEDLFELVDYKPKKPTHLVVWEEGGDPCKFFDSKDKADTFAKELSEKSSVKEDSIVIVEIKSAKKLTIRKYIRTSDYKI